MKLTTTVLALAFAFAAATAAAAESSPPKTLSPQQQKMKDCNAQATGKSGDERRAFMSTCLKGGASKAADSTSASTPKASPAPAAASAPAHPSKSLTKQEKKACNAQAAGKSGDERKAALSACHKGSVAAR